MSGGSFRHIPPLSVAPAISTIKSRVEGLTELSKSENTDNETKVMYREMIKALFETFTSNMRSSQDISTYLKEF